jgi:hypothetical protein
MKSLLPQFQEEENKKFDVLMRKMYISGLLDGREKANTHIRVKDIMNGMNTTETVTFLEEMDKTLSSSHSRLIDKIVEMVEEKAEFWKKQKAIRYPEYVKGINKCGEELSDFIQSKLKQ